MATVATVSRFDLASGDRLTRVEFERRYGVQEYLVWRVYDGTLDWFCLHEGQYLPLHPDAAGVLESPLFPGLRLHVSALLAGDMGTVLAELQGGLASPAYAALIARWQNPS
jgi:hypothetical protein